MRHFALRVKPPPQSLTKFDMFEIHITYMGNNGIWRLASSQSNRAGQKGVQKTAMSDLLRISLDKLKAG